MAQLNSSPHEDLMITPEMESAGTPATMTSSDHNAAVSDLTPICLEPGFIQVPKESGALSAPRSLDRRLIAFGSAVVGITVGMLLVDENAPSRTGFTMVALILSLGIFGIWFYWAPIHIASRRNHRKLSAIHRLTALTGWTFLGWLAALIWAHSEDNRTPGNPDQG
jgi:hypothetical protein